MEWPFNYPGNDFITNVFGQVIVTLEDIGEKAKDIVDNIKEK